MAGKNIFNFMRHIRNIENSVFTTRELALMTGKSVSAVSQVLDKLYKEKVIFKICRGVWSDAGRKDISPYTVIPYLFPKNRAYVSFVSALHLYGIVEQIPQMITVASMAHTKIIKTNIGIFSAHKISPDFFTGFDWYKKTGGFLIAEPEKALIDSLYLSARKQKNFGHFPELYFPKDFSFKRARFWVKKIPYNRIRTCVEKKLDKIQATGDKRHEKDYIK